MSHSSPLFALIKTKKNKIAKTFVLLIKTSCGGNALYIYRDDVSRAGCDVFRRPSSPLLRRCGLLRDILGSMVSVWPHFRDGRFLGPSSGRSDTAVEIASCHL